MLASAFCLFSCLDPKTLKSTKHSLSSHDTECLLQCYNKRGTVISERRNKQMWGGDTFIPVHWSYTKLAILLSFPDASLPPQHRRCSGSSHRWIIYLSFLLLKLKSTVCDTSFQTVVTSSTASGLLTGLLDASLPKAALPWERDEY